MATLFNNHPYMSSSGTPVSTKFTATYMYHIRSIRYHGYYLVHLSTLCDLFFERGNYSREVTIESGI